jgi:hypothetical protein
LVFLCLPVALVPAQETVEIFGYLESQMMGGQFGDEFLQLYTNKLRVDLAGQPTENVSLAANFDYITYHGKTVWNVLDFMAPDIVNSIPEEMTPFYVIPFADRIFLDNAYIKLAFEKFDLTLGKQQISIGSGYVWNPLDLFNVKDVLDPAYEQPGHNALRIDIPVGTDYTLTALYSPEDVWSNSSGLLQFKGRISRFDYSIVAVQKYWRFHDYSRFDPAAFNFVAMPERRRLIGGSTAGELFGFGVWAEYGYNDMETSDDFHEIVVGGDYTFDFQTYVMAEFFRNTSAKTDFRDYDINDWMRQLAAEQKSIARDQFYLFAQHPITDFIYLGLSTIYSISDNSAALVPTLNYNLAENVDILAYLNVNFGEEGKAFSRNTGSGGLLRARVYF